MTFQTILRRLDAFSLTAREKGDRFERLMRDWLMADPVYASRLEQVWLWRDFPWKDDFGGSDLGIDLVARDNLGEYLAIQCKYHSSETLVDKAAVDSFISNSSRLFGPEKKTGFASRLWIAVNEIWGPNAEEAVRNQLIPFARIHEETLSRSPVDWQALTEKKPQNFSPKTPFPHQGEAVAKAVAHFARHDRGQLVMACGTGKTYTSLLIAQKLAPHGSVLFLVPSISLLNQSLNAWMADCNTPINAICVCSDAKASRKKGDERAEDLFDLALPATTDASQIAVRYLAAKDLTVVFSTYQSLAKVREAQEKISEKLGEPHSFDLIICDEAHRTTGITGDGDDFTSVHDNGYIRGDKRLYMTATPRLYADNVKSRARESDFELCSMDDESVYGPEFYRVSFSYAVANGLLTDYKVLVLTVGSQWQLPPALRVEMADKKELAFDHLSRLIGCVNGLAKNTTDNDLVWEADPRIMRRAIAFCPNIDKKGDPGSSKNTAARLGFVSEKLAAEKSGHRIEVRAEHIDGTMDSSLRSRKLWWLAEETDNPEECRILCNVRCLSEGIDVPALDAAIFLSPRSSQVDVVQSVGRVMRNFRKGAPDAKKYGYIIIPVVVNPEIPAEEALNDNKAFAPVWSVLNALRSHDERFNAIINSISLNHERPDKIVVAQPPFYAPDEVQEPRLAELRRRIGAQASLLRELDEKIYARMVEKVGSRLYWERWARDIGPIASGLIARISELIKVSGPVKDGFAKFLKSLRLSINDAISERQAVEMLGQHLVVRPVFQALFSDYSFESNNGVTKAMQEMLNILDANGLREDSGLLDRFNESVKLNLASINTLSGRQTVIKNLYDSFFRGAFPKAVEQLGIVYTPIEVVDFILRSVDGILRREFNTRLSDRGVHILDPFAGTGTFITRLLQSGLISPADLERKYREEIHANELVLLAYYVADVNIEAVFHSLSQRREYLPYNGICLTDTFALEGRGPEPSLFPMMEQNARDIKRQSEAPIRVIIGNPPYSAGQKSANDNAQNLKYPQLDKRIEQTYVSSVSVTNKNSLYDSYIRAFRWASDRLGDEGGVIGFVTNSKWLDGNAAAGFRETLTEEFSAIYVFDLKGAIRGKANEEARREGESVFNIMTGTCVVILVRNPAHEGKAKIHYCDIGDYLSRRRKLDIVAKYGSIFSPEMEWADITPDEHGDWLRQRSGLFESFIPIGDKKGKGEAVFEPVYSNGLKTQRDAWCWNFSKAELKGNIRRAIEFYNAQCEEAAAGRPLNRDARCFSWTRAAEQSQAKCRKFQFAAGEAREGQYRPFCRQNLYFSRQLNEMVYQMPRLFPTEAAENRVIILESPGGRKDFSCFITDKIPDLHLLEAAQCFPLYYYAPREGQGSLMGESQDAFEKRPAVSDWAARLVRSRYGKSQISREDIFYFVYGILHEPAYRSRFADDLKKTLPRLPLPANYADFARFAQAGRDLAELHLNYEKTSPCAQVTVTGAESGNFAVEKMKFAGKAGQWDKSRIIYNSSITICDIPPEAYAYVVNGRSAIEWIMESYRIKTDQASGIINNPNSWAEEHHKPRYILDLLLSVIGLSLRTVEITRQLPKLEWGEGF